MEKKVRKPEEIIADMKVLDEELKQSRHHYQWKLLWDGEGKEQYQKRRIGFFEMEKAETILTALNEGKKLKLMHGSGKKEGYNVQMNPNGNRVLVTNGDDFINENRIMDFIVWNAGSWYVEDLEGGKDVQA